MVKVVSTQNCNDTCSRNDKSAASFIVTVYTAEVYTSATIQYALAQVLQLALSITPIVERYGTYFHTKYYLSILNAE